jgi:hypothetical protein
VYSREEIQLLLHRRRALEIVEEIIARYSSLVRQYITINYRLSTRGSEYIFVSRVRYNSTSTTSIARDSSSDYTTQ